MQRFSRMWSGLRPRWLTVCGWLANLGFPCVVRETQYESAAHGVSVRVRVSKLFTVVTVNGVDVYFYRLTGRIDGVGFSPSADCMASETSQSARSDAQF